MSTSYTEKTHSAFHGAPIDTSDPKTLAWLIRRHGLEMTHISRGSHIGAIFSVAEIMAVLYTRILRVDPKNPQWENRDRLILSKGHAARRCMRHWRSAAFSRWRSFPPITPTARACPGM